MATVVLPQQSEASPIQVGVLWHAHWLDPTGGHIVEVASGRTVDLPAEVIGCDDLQWQPIAQ